MTPLKEFNQWMENHGGNYINDSGILFNSSGELVFVDSPWPNYGSTEVISIVLLCIDGRELFKTLCIETVADLDKVQPETMLNLFYAGHAIVLCTTADRESLTFQKVRDTMIAIIDGVDLGHEVMEKLVMPVDFIRYTNEYFSFMNAYKRKKERRSMGRKC